MIGDGLAPRRRLPAGVRLLVFTAVVMVLVAATVVVINRVMDARSSPAEAVRIPTESPAAVPLTTPARLSRLTAPAGTPAPGGSADRRTLVLYDDGGATGLGHRYGIQVANLASHDSAWTLRPVRLYRSGELSQHTGVVYLGVSDTPLPETFLRDLTRAKTPVLWLGSGIDQLFRFDPGARQRLGWSPAGNDPGQVTGVRYRERLLPRRVPGQDRPIRIAVHDPSTARVLGVAEHDDGSTSPWAVGTGPESAGLVYVSEMPFSYSAPGDRSLAAADLISRTARPDGPDRRRALIRIEDVGPNSNPAEITAIADYLSRKGVPFTLSVYPYYRDPQGAAHHGKQASFRLVDRPEMVDALNYAITRGAVIALHGLSHQYADRSNPYRGTSADDYEFYLAHVDEADNVKLDGPVPEDSVAWATNRMQVGRAEFVRAGLPDPDIFEFPHYTASAASYVAANQVFGVRYDQGSYFDGLCPDGDCARSEPDAGLLFQQFFPFLVRDVYGSAVVPENLLNVSSSFNNSPPRSVRNVLDNAAAMTVVRDGVVSTYYHPFLGVDRLAQIVEGIERLQYTFVSPYELLE